MIHTACPVILGVPKSQAFDKLIFPAMRGTQNVLRSVNRTRSVEKGEWCKSTVMPLQQAGRCSRRAAGAQLQAAGALHHLLAASVAFGMLQGPSLTGAPISSRFPCSGDDVL